MNKDTNSLGNNRKDKPFIYQQYVSSLEHIYILQKFNLQITILVDKYRKQARRTHETMNHLFITNRCQQWADLLFVKWLSELDVPRVYIIKCYCDSSDLNACLISIDKYSIFNGNSFYFFAPKPLPSRQFWVTYMAILYFYFFADEKGIVSKIDIRNERFKNPRTPLF